LFQVLERYCAAAQAALGSVQLIVDSDWPGASLADLGVANMPGIPMPFIPTLDDIVRAISQVWSYSRHLNDV
jgi:hypothetical protein